MNIESRAINIESEIDKLEYELKIATLNDIEDAIGNALRGNY